MLRIHETNTQGITQIWEMKMGSCPACGSACSIDHPCTPATPKRLLCCSCSYSEGYSYSPASH